MRSLKLFFVISLAVSSFSAYSSIFPSWVPLIGDSGDNKSQLTKQNKSKNKKLRDEAAKKDQIINKCASKLRTQSNDFSEENVMECHNNGYRYSLHLAALYGYHNLIPTFKKEQKVNLNTSNKVALPPLYYAALNGHKETFRVLYTLGANINQRIVFKNVEVSLLHLAALTNYELALYLISEGADVSERASNTGDSILHYAALNVDENTDELIVALIEKGFDINIKNKKNETPLYQAAQAKLVSNVNTLLNLGANIESNFNFTLLNEEFLNDLIEYGELNNSQIRTIGKEMLNKKNNFSEDLMGRFYPILYLAIAEDSYEAECVSKLDPIDFKSIDLASKYHTGELPEEQKRKFHKKFGPVACFDILYSSKRAVKGDLKPISEFGQRFASDLAEKLNLRMDLLGAAN
ncbi:MAG: hypothetical protein HOO06_04240 [Bdellovibrionaceae bacterium]|jgi:ankyrin repeat protein|nr:hypothetical protein [Pseudobdellovibrionaceae bacterium]